jgi:hypothetical protein
MRGELEKWNWTVICELGVWVLDWVTGGVENMELASGGRAKGLELAHIVPWDGLAPNCSIGCTRCRVAAQAIACERHVIHDHRNSL